MSEQDAQLGQDPPLPVLSFTLAFQPTLQIPSTHPHPPQALTWTLSQKRSVFYHCQKWHLYVCGN